MNGEVDDVNIVCGIDDFIYIRNLHIFAVFTMTKTYLGQISTHSIH